VGQASPAEKTATAYVTIRNPGAEVDRLQEVVPSIADKVELHGASPSGGDPVLVPGSGLELPAGGVIEMKPNAVHLVLVQVNPPLRVDDRFPLVLIFEKAGPIRIDLDVLGAGS
jgi:copper(I)-binding protein